MHVDPVLETPARAFPHEVVGVTGYTPDIPNVFAICNECKSPDATATTLVGAYHAALCREDFDVEYVDCVVVGEGEKTLPELVDASERGNTDLRKIASFI